MTIGQRASGAWAAGTTSVVMTLPGTPVAGDMMIMYVGCKPFNATIVTPSGWTSLIGSSNGTVASGVDVGSVLWGIFYREFVAGDTAPTVSITSGNVALGIIQSYSKTTAAWETPVNNNGGDNSSGTAFSLSISLESVVGDMLAHFATIAGNNATFGSPTLSGNVGTVAESPATEGTTALGNDLESSASFGLATGSNSTTTCAWTLSAAQTGGGCLVRLREIPLPRARTLQLVSHHAAQHSTR